MKQNLKDAGWLALNIWALFAISGNGDMTFWRWVVFAWACVNICILGFGLLSRGVSALFDYVIRDMEKRDGSA